MNGIPIKVRQYDYDTLNTERTYKPTYILTFDYQNIVFFVTVRSTANSPFEYEEKEMIKQEELENINQLIVDNILGKRIKRIVSLKVIVYLLQKSSLMKK